MMLKCIICNDTMLVIQYWIEIVQLELDVLEFTSLFNIRKSLN